MNCKLGKTLILAAVAAFGLAPLAATAASQGDGPDTVPITAVLTAVAKRSGKKFMVDPRVQGDALLIQGNPETLSYDDLLMLLNVHGFAAVPSGDYVRVIPDASVRHMALPVADGGKHSPAEYVTRVFSVKSIPTSLLVPLLRPMIPQHGHLVALPCTNHLLMVDTFANTQRLEQVIKSMDQGERYVPEKCAPGVPARATRKDDER